MFEPGNFETINRAALTIKAKQPFYDWLNSIEHEDNLSESLQDIDVYLLPNYEELTQIEGWLYLLFKNFPVQTFFGTFR